MGKPYRKCPKRYYEYQTTPDDYGYGYDKDYPDEKPYERTDNKVYTISPGKYEGVFAATLNIRTLRTHLDKINGECLTDMMDDIMDCY